MLVNMRGLLRDAQACGVAVGSFSVSNMEMILGILQAAEEQDVPVILQIAEVRLKQSPLELIGPMMVAAARRTRVPTAVHLDHGLTLAAIRQALELGFTSVMLDASAKPYEENVALTRQVVRMARASGAAVEAEIGAVGGSEDGGETIAARCTDPEQAARFAAETGVDALAVAIGNAHGNYRRAPQLRFDILQQVHSRIPIPLVLHGGTGITEDDFRRCIANGVHKINIATATFGRVEQTVRAAYQTDEIRGYYDLQAAEVRGAYENARYHIDVFHHKN